MKIKTKTKSILNIILALNLMFPIGYINNIDSYATVIDENKIIDKWETKTNMPTERTELTSAVVDGKIYCIGGSGSSYFLNSVEVYDPATDRWESKTPMPTKRRGLTSALVDGKIYCIGGEVGYNSYTNKVEVYDPETDTWETKTSMPTTRGYFSSAVVNDKIYCIGGYGGSSYYNVVEVYDPKTDTWETKTPMPIVKAFLASVVVDDKIYCIGGRNGTYLNTVEVYDPTTDSWETKTPMPTSRAYLTSEVVNGKIYCIGGRNSSYLNTVEVYDPVKDTWETKTSMPTSRSGLASVAVNGKIYCIGGYNGSPITTVEVYTPNTNTNTPEYRTEQAVISAENSRDITDIETARNLVNQLEEGELKNDLQDRLNAIVPNLTLDVKNTTANVDIYIKSENMLLMSLSTNSITFEDYSGVEEIEKTNALTININSSLAYDLNAYLVSEIQNADGSNKIDIDRLNIKANDENTYQEFAGINQKLTLKSNCSSGNDIPHNIDLKLNGDDAYPADIYKTVIKFEAEQK